MAIANASLARLKKFMEDSGFTHTMEWLGACVDWIQENYPGADFQVLQREVLDQWKDANLEEMESMCLPRGLAGQKLVEIPAGKKYGLQLITIRDIGESSYSQWTKIKKLESENVSVAATDSNEVKPAWQPAPKRCLYLDMTDGTQQVFGMEINPIRGLSLDLKPGAKIIIVGPVNCRRGVFHLKPNNVMVVGGEVEDLVETNKTEKILARILNISVDDSRYPQPPSTPAITSSSTASTVRVGSDVISGDFPDSEDQFPDMEAFGEDDSLFMEIDEEEIISSATSASSSIAKQPTKQNSSTNKSVFVPPSTVIASANKKSVPTTTPLFSSNKSSSSTSASSTTTSKVNQNSSTSGSDFKTAKSALASSSNSASKGKDKGNGKQLNILQYMKPMPVTIDPPTPERRLKRQRKSVEEGVPIKHEQDRKPSIKKEPICDTTILLNSDEDDISEEQPPEDEPPNFEEEDFFDSSPDASLMRIVDQAVEDRFMEASQDDVKPKDLKPLSEELTTKESGSTSTSANVAKNKTPIQRKVPGHPYVFIQQIEASLKEHLVPQKVATVKACISTIVSNINIEGECWKLEVSLNDGTGYLNCQMCSSLLNTIIGFSPMEMKAIKAQKTKEGKRKISEAMNGLATKLVHLNGLFSIEIGKEAQPLVINISELMPHHSVALKDRLKQIGLE